ncbi:MAG: DsbA family protein [Myxococcaceae bacterium]
MKPNVIVALLVGLIVGFFVGKVVSGPSTDNPPSVAAPAAPAPSPSPGGGQIAEGEDATFKVPLDNAPVSGNADALVTIVEFSDYQCPFCSRGNATIQQLQKDYGSKLRVAMKQNPLPFHEHARPAALAALAAGEQGKYWEMHEKMFANATALDGASLEKYAKEIGLDVAKWQEAMKSPKHSDTIGKDQALAQSLGATGTPAFFINGQKLVGAQPIDRFKAVIDAKLKKAEELVASGTKPSEVYAKTIANGATAPAPAAPQAPAAPPAPAALKKINVPSDSPLTGPKLAKVTIIEWSDFQCPFCSRVVPTLKQIKEAYPKDVRVIFRHQPLPFHNNAKIAAEASMAALEQGKFWEMHDKLFANQSALDQPNLEKYAQELKLDVKKFKAALESHKFAAKIDADASEGASVGANGTPTFFINGRELVGAQPFPSFKAMIDEEITKADKLLASGVKLENLYQKQLEAAPTAAAAPSPGGAPAPAPVQDITVGSAPVKGPKNAPVTIVAFSDFQCPFCSRVVPTLKQIEDQYGGKVRVAFKHQPLPFHNNAKLAAEASLAANEQGKFWEYHDKLFANQSALDRPNLERYAEELKLDLTKFKTALDSKKFDAQVAADSTEGSRVGANGTPTFFINGRQLVGAQPIDAFKQIIDEELKKKGK